MARVTGLVYDRSRDLLFSISYDKALQIFNTKSHRHVARHDLFILGYGH
jgi:hypothetical protein